ncbi:hypothetical protein [Lacipirellula sp.]|uniref:hypothetical protein n=1 Tax=Lacipirellula sp. TaxID=2691419 RepID=UPI003D1102E0
MGSPIEPKLEHAKIIPQLFFDVIARIVPGALAILAGLLLTGSTWLSLFNTVIAGVGSTESRLVPALLAFGFASYLAGQMMSPAVKTLQRLMESICVMNFFIRREALSYFCDIERKKPKDSDGKSSKKPDENPDQKSDGGYDELRLRHPAVGEMCQKIRAEFLMHYGIAVVLATSAAITLLPSLSPAIEGWCRRLLLFVALLIGALASAVRGRATCDTHDKTVVKFLKAYRSLQESAVASASTSDSQP